MNGKIFVGLVNDDNTMEWMKDKHIQVNQNNAEFMYSCLTELEDGRIALLYEDHQSGWGAGADKYYTMDFQTYPFEVIPKRYQITLEQTEGGMIACAVEEGEENTKAEITAEPSECYRLSYWLVNGERKEAVGTVYEIVLQEDVKVSAVFEKIPDGGNEDGDEKYHDQNSDDDAVRTPPQKEHAPSYASKGNWNQEGETWSFIMEDGQPAVSRWICTEWNGTYQWYYFDQEGKMADGWIDIDGQTFYLAPESDGTRGQMVTGWKLIDGVWYYFNTDSDGTKGILLKNTVTPDGFSVDEEGRWVHS